MRKSASQLLSEFDFTIAQARDFISANSNDIGAIYNAAKSVGLTNSNFAEITGYTELEVVKFLNTYGFDTAALDAGGISGRRFDVIALGFGDSVTPAFIDVSGIAATLAIEFDSTNNFMDFTVLNTDFANLNVTGFGSDDRIEIVGAPNFFAPIFEGVPGQVRLYTEAPGGAIDGSVNITLTGIAGDMVMLYDMASFNRLSVGDVVIV